MLKKEAIATIEDVIGYVFDNKQLISQAFTRSSYHYEHTEDQDNEVLEFVGDSVLSLIVVNILCALVNKQFLAKQMGKLCLQEYLRMSIGDEIQGVKNGKSVLEDLLESIVGAVYIDSGENLEKTTAVVEKILDIDRFLKENDGEVRISYKNDVQEWCQRYGYDLPVYRTNQTWEGYTSSCEIEELGVCERGIGHNRKEAENAAAELVLQKLEEEFEPDVNKFIVTFENAVNMLQEYCQSEDMARPEYETMSDTINDDNSHTFVVRCYLGNRYADGTGSKVKDAKKSAAYKMLEYLGVL